MIGTFETRLRNYILNEMRGVYKEEKNEWYTQLKEITLVGEQLPFNTIYDKFVFRRNEDLKNKILPEEELISYADIIDYKKYYSK